MKNKAYAKFGGWGTNKVHYGKCGSDECPRGRPSCQVVLSVVRVGGGGEGEGGRGAVKWYDSHKLCKCISLVILYICT